MSGEPDERPDGAGQPKGAPTRTRDLGRLLDKVSDLDLHLNLPAARPMGTLPARARKAAAAPQRHAMSRRRRPGVFGLWLLSAPLLLSAVMALAAGRFGGFIGDALGWGLIALGAVLTRGSADDPGALERRFSRRLRLSRRNLGGLAVAAGVTLAAVLGVGHSLPVGLAFGALAALAFHLIYRFEPLLAGEKLGTGDRESRQVAEALAEAEQRLITIEQAARAVGNPELEARLGRIAAEGRGMLAQIAERPSDLRRARRFLTVFLEGAEQVSDGYVRTHRHSDSPELTQSFRNVLITIEEQFHRQRERLRRADVMDLDVQIEVLRKQLEQEGLR
ncbi:5-bromo-4-chloroindolyl phosphate hydrolysis family protein [uncultured Thiohalocapsa sp.]|uniref:5-bromo-4-chloroindolyl phosphate hydrolysis family protein n=1 Tax=uncultured Thiohalocapsa sp. TaxID=768990 RepID=UPI0025DF4E8F|nr:5-bromo-4-chloroindolyl phosphate hydrolysis family protein [uncultured Thiohalocapsa sp.]